MHPQIRFWHNVFPNECWSMSKVVISVTSTSLAKFVCKKFCPQIKYLILWPPGLPLWVFTVSCVKYNYFVQNPPGTVTAEYRNL